MKIKIARAGDIQGCREQFATREIHRARPGTAITWRIAKCCVVGGSIRANQAYGFDSRIRVDHAVTFVRVLANGISIWSRPITLERGIKSSDLARLARF